MTDIVSQDIEWVIKDLQKFSNKLEGKNILIVGGKGFLGTYFVKILQTLNKSFTKPCKIIVLDNLITAKHKETFDDSNTKFIEQDISKKFDIEDDLDFIIHSASIASPIVYRKFPLKTIDVNYQGTRNLLELARQKNIEGMLLLSSSEVYGDPAIVPTPESYWGHVSCTGPRACYDESKRLAETVAILYSQLYNVPIKIARPFNVYGPYLNLEDGRIIPDFIKNSLDHSEIIIHSDGTPTRSFCYVTDAMKAFFKILLLPPGGSIFNVGNDEEISVHGVAETIKKIINPSIKIKIQKSSDPNYVIDNPQRRCPNLEYITNTLDFIPEISLQQGIERIYSWYKVNSN
ncbi:NAD-dependent dehydratase [Nitrosopumilus cobalaminigenes]|uniref:NAD-dependent dehydratase n=1 Tax=Nitrosopumilus cobalaminigenes TaxID=1470066 RepID=A0A7D5LYT6_9ARCH|nr:NAD-dependent epimerase/dehydratase family protein [Nitrosopumilus cobalaminigenes]QLH02212.1 NAD-dependent dehydratase [Nitrosopumilus cobalaminigenes]